MAFPWLILEIILWNIKIISTQAVSQSVKWNLHDVKKIFIRLWFHFIQFSDFKENSTEKKKFGSNFLSRIETLVFNTFPWKSWTFIFAVFKLSLEKYTEEHENTFLKCNMTPDLNLFGKVCLIFSVGNTFDIFLFLSSNNFLNIHWEHKCFCNDTLNWVTFSGKMFEIFEENGFY